MDTITRAEFKSRFNMIAQAARADYLDRMEAYDLLSELQSMPIHDSVHDWEDSDDYPLDIEGEV